MKQKKIVILYSTGGMGHKKAAIALYKEFQEKVGSSMKIEIIDVLEYANKMYKFLYLDLYLFLMKSARWLWGALYDFSNIPLVDRLTSKLRGALDYRSLPGFGKMLIEKKPDAVVATHYLLPSIAEILEKDPEFHADTFAVMTDYGPHSWWLSDYIGKFFVGCDSAAKGVAERGIPKEKIEVTGIPTTEEFSKEFNKPELMEKYGLEEDRKTIFLMSGGFGVGPIEEMLLSLNLCTVPIQVITVCGHNKEAYNKLKGLKKNLNYPVVLFGFTDEVAQLMSVSDLMITKAGGISVTEALNMELPMILFASVPGQETWNEKLLVSNGAAEKAEKIDDIPVITNRVLFSEDVYDALKAGIAKVRRPDATKKIVDAVLSKIGESG